MSITNATQPTEYKDGRTKQAFRDDCDINVLMSKQRRRATLSHLEKFQPEYGDFADFDFLEANVRLSRGREIFEALPSEVRKEFDGKPSEFFKFVNDPANRDQLKLVLPELAEPGEYFATPMRDLLAATAAEAAKAAVTATTQGGGQDEGEKPVEGATEPDAQPVDSG